MVGIWKYEKDRRRWWCICHLFRFNDEYFDLAFVLQEIEPNAINKLYDSFISTHYNQTSRKSMAHGEVSHVESSVPRYRLVGFGGPRNSSSIDHYLGFESIKIGIV
jgi:hypothetical protein